MEASVSMNVADAFSVRGQVALVTGAAGFIGGGIAEAFAVNGARVALTDQPGERLDRRAAEWRDAGRDALVLPGDLADPATPAALVRSVVERFGQLDSLVNCAGVGLSPPLDRQTVEHADRLMNVNVRAVWQLIQAAVEPMARQGGGRVVNISSVNGHRATFLCPVYAASKAGVLALTRELAVELAPRGIRVNSVSPGLVAHLRDAGSWVSRFLREPHASRFAERTMAHRRRNSILEQPLALAGEPIDIAMACLYLCSPASRFVTGADLLVDGGRQHEMPLHEERFRTLARDEEWAALRKELEALPDDAWIRKPSWLQKTP